MPKIQIKPLSVNEAWKGRRFKTPKYKRYERDVLTLLPRIKIPEGELSIELEFGVSNKQSDWDNPIKAFVDILQKKFGFDDNRIYEATVRKVLVKKKEEYISFNIKEKEK